MTHPGAAKRLLMVMPHSGQVRKAAEAGFEVWVVGDPSLRGRAYLDEVAEHAREVVSTGVGDERELRALIARTVRVHDIDTVLYLGGAGAVGPAVAEAERLGVSPNPASAVVPLDDKSAMRALLSRHGLSPVRSETVPTVSGVAAAVARLSGPVVVEPARASGDLGVALIRDPAGLEEWSERVADTGPDGPYVVEEYLEGPEFGVETLSADGVHQVVGITAKRTTGGPYFVATEHVYPAPLGPVERASVHAVVTGLLDLAGYRFGPAHTEVVLTRLGPRIVGARARSGGDLIPLLVETASDFDVEAGVFRLLSGVPVGEPRPRHTVSVGFFLLPAGRLEAVEGLDAIRALPYVQALHFPYVPGDELPRTTGSSTRHGYVVVDAESPAEAAERLARVRELLRTRVREAAAALPAGTPR
ncbi:ATP-grasp domain-containing protein (plasmid) [Streptomyces sp. NBC_01216]|uniref:ATP-grasp domain-containing protein n=1 Tax=Streptomyces sp. NBC_01216 TaxID=2903778 RepID=UPI002E14F5AD|nr:ATP-grasp domain-containing protein [Streptomyces sp. NBC_01216]